MGGVDWHYLRDEFAKQDLYFMDYTPSRRDSHRGEEIKEWLESTGYDVESYVVIDDEMFDIWDESDYEHFKAIVESNADSESQASDEN